MPWLPIDQTDVNDQRVDVLAKNLGVDRAHALGCYVAFLLFMQHYEITGDTTRKPAEIVALGSQWKGSPEVFIDALKGAGILDLFGNVADWQNRMQYYAIHLMAQETKIVKKRAQAAGRKQAQRTREAVADTTAAIMRGEYQPTETEVNAGNRSEPLETVVPGHVVCHSEMSRSKERTKEPENEIKKEPTIAPRASDSVVPPCERVDFARKTEVGFSLKEVESPTWRAMRAVLEKLSLSPTESDRVVESVKARCKSRGSNPLKSDVMNPIGNLIFVLERNRDPGKPSVRNPVSYILNCNMAPNPYILTRQYAKVTLMAIDSTNWRVVHCSGDSIENTFSAVAATSSGNPVSLTTVSLSVGEWSVSGSLLIAGGAYTSGRLVLLANSVANGTSGDNALGIDIASTGNGNSLSLSEYRFINTGAAATMNLIGNTVFSVAPSLYGRLTARRIR